MFNNVYSIYKSRLPLDLFEANFNVVNNIHYDFLLLDFIF